MLAQNAAFDSTADPTPVNEAVALADVSLVLRQKFGVAVSYQRLWRAATEGAIPATRMGSRWFVFRSDLAAIALSFTLK